MTVLGPVDPSVLGHVQPHEHAIIDTTRPYEPWSGPSFPEFALDEEGLYEAALVPENYDEVRRFCLNRDNLRLTDEVTAVRELQWYRRAGGGAIVECTPKGLGRDLSGLERISRESGVHIVAGCGWYVREYHPAAVSETSEEALFAELCRDVLVGEAESGVRAGVIGEIGLSWPVEHDEVRVLRAAARAQAETGVALIVHPGRDELAPRRALDIVAEAGGDVTRTAIAHVERTLFSEVALLDLATTGCYLGFDLFGQEASFYPWAPIDMPNDSMRVDMLLGLSRAGHGRRLLVSQDVCYRTALRTYGGPGYAHVLAHVLPLMRRKGFSDDEITTITVSNPAELLTVQKAIR